MSAKETTKRTTDRNQQRRARALAAERSISYTAALRQLGDEWLPGELALFKDILDKLDVLRMVSRDSSAQFEATRLPLARRLQDMEGRALSLPGARPYLESLVDELERTLTSYSEGRLDYEISEEELAAVKGDAAWEMREAEALATKFGITRERLRMWMVPGVPVPLKLQHRPDFQRMLAELDAESVSPVAIESRVREIDGKLVDLRSLSPEDASLFEHEHTSSLSLLREVPVETSLEWATTTDDLRRGLNRLLIHHAVEGARTVPQRPRQ